MKEFASLLFRRKRVQSQGANLEFFISVGELTTIPAKSKLGFAGLPSGKNREGQARK